MLSIPIGVSRFFESALTRAVLFIFLYLSLAFSRMYISASVGAYPVMAMWCNILVDVNLIIIAALRWGDRSEARDICTLAFIGVLIHLAYLPFYHNGIDVSAYHNGAQKIINWLIVSRLFYVGERDIIAPVSLITRTKNFLLNERFFLNAYVNGLTAAVTIFCAAPLCALIYIINTDEIRTTGIAITLFSFYIAFSSAGKRIAETIDVEVTQSERDSFDVANERYRELEVWFIVFVATSVIVGLGLIASMNFYKVSFFDAGYASGFSDAKSGAAPKKETDFNKALACIEINRAHFPSPSDAGCPAKAKPWH
jgi:hypothetical protein